VPKQEGDKDACKGKERKKTIKPSQPTL